MSDSFVAVSKMLPYLAPPVIGAFIGYLTNRVAIRMLFRPLKKWRIGPIPVPMTPGVIPSKRHALAVNIGEMVGEHLLTSEEIGKSLRKKEFQDHLYQLIESKLETLMKQDLGPLPSIIPQRYGSYFDIAVKTIVYRLKESVNDYLHSDNLQHIVNASSEKMLSSLLDMKVDDLLPSEQRDITIDIIGNQLEGFINCEAFEILIKKTLTSKIAATVNSGACLSEVLPEQLNSLIVQMTANQAPSIAESAADLLGNPEIINKITLALRGVIEEFINGLGPMAAMVHNFLDMKVVEEKITEYLARDENDIRKILEDERVVLEIEAVLRAKAEHVLTTPVKDLLKEYDPAEVSVACDQVCGKLLKALRHSDGMLQLRNAIRDHFETRFFDKDLTLGSLLADLTNSSDRSEMKTWLGTKIVLALRSQSVKEGMQQIIDQMALRFIEKPIGRLSNFIPAGVRGGIYESIQQAATRMLSSEVPGIVKSLNIRRIVTERIDTFDLLRLEKLLLSIMEEQFKYINLFGGILGFLIGCINLVIVYGWR